MSAWWALAPAAFAWTVFCFVVAVQASGCAEVEHGHTGNVLQ